MFLAQEGIVSPSKSTEGLGFIVRIVGVVGLRRVEQQRVNLKGKRKLSLLNRVPFQERMKAPVIPMQTRLAINLCSILQNEACNQLQIPPRWNTKEVYHGLQIRLKQT